MNKADTYYLLDELKEYAKKDVEGLINFKASLWFRNYLLASPIPVKIANRLAITVKIEINDELWKDDEVKEFVEAFACNVANLVKAYLKHGFSSEDIYKIGKNLSMKF